MKVERNMKMTMSLGGVCMLTFATIKINRGTMLYKTLIHQECHVKKYGMEKLQMGSNLKHIKKTKTQQNKSFVIVTM
jgi:hypothetical protein